MHATTTLATILSLAAFSAAQVTVVVGAAGTAVGGAFQFMPPNITASNGTVVTFTWQGSPGNHSVTQSTPDAPCQPAAGGFDSGFVFIPANTTTGFPSWNLTITDDSTPIYFYCGQLAPVPHCSSGMVGSINAPTSGNGSFVSFQAAAIATNGTTPGTPVPNLQGNGANATVLPGPFSGSVAGFGLPSGPTASNAVALSSVSVSAASASSSASAASSGASSGAPSPTTTSAAQLNSVSSLFVFIATVFGIALV